jgi:hypothetical protein
MDDFERRWPYRCLPIVVANQAGWWIPSPVSFTASWSGEMQPSAVTLEFDDDAERWSRFIVSHFGGGVLTVHLPWLFRTEQPIGLHVRGAVNHCVDGAVALEGLVESWGLEASFTMNWRILHPDAPVRFEKGEPICMIVPVDVSLFEAIRPVVAPLASDPDLERRHIEWHESRAAFVEAIRTPDQIGWQKTYTRGERVDGTSVDGHLTRLRVAEFAALEDTV